MKNTRSADFYADRIDVRTNFAVITNVVIKRFHCSNFCTNIFSNLRYVMCLPVFLFSAE